MSDLAQRLRDIAHGINAASNQATLREAADEIERLRGIINPGTAAAHEAYAAELRTDARRYRWLRDRSVPPDAVYSTTDFDAAIDAALQQEPG